MEDNTKGLDLSQESDKDLQDLLQNELYIDINSKFAKEIEEELKRRGIE